MIETDRLFLIPLTVTQLKSWIENIPALEKELNCIYRAEPTNGIFFDIVKGQLKILMEDEVNYLYHTFWFLVRKSDRIVIGSADFKGRPNTDGEVEIGYGLGKEFEHNGYMTEAVKAMCQWVMKQEHISHVIAETDIDGISSQRILQRCGFKQYKQGDTLWWKL